MNVSHDGGVARVAAAVGDPARARMLYSLADGRARTSTELAVVSGVSPSTASAHLKRLHAARLVQVVAQGRHRYYRLSGPPVAAALEALSVVAGREADRFIPATPHRLRRARTCYDHMAGTVGVSLHDGVLACGWLSRRGNAGEYEVTTAGARALSALGLDLDALRRLRRRFAFGCLDWSERRPHLGGALGAALFDLARARRWVEQDLDSRALSITAAGRRELIRRFGVAPAALSSESGTAAPRRPDADR